MALDRSPELRLALAAIWFSGVEPFKQVFVMGNPNNISVKLF